MKRYRGAFGTFDTVYLGGGTPSLLRPEELELIFQAMHDHFDVSAGSEITLEMNPGDLKTGYFRALRTLGVTRLNIGVQSFYPPALAFLGRRHSVQDSKAAIKAARAAGFDNLGLDLIYGIPAMPIPAWTETLKTALFFEPEHLSCYELSLSAGTPLGQALHEKSFSLPDEHLMFDLFMMTADLLEAEGYIHYEVSNYARDASWVSCHNLKYWDHSPFLGLGPGAHSYQDRTRWWNHRSVLRYAGALDEGEMPVEGKERLSEEDLLLETLFLGLRTRRGIDLRLLRDRSRVDLEKEKKETLRSLEAGGFIFIQDGHLIPTRRGYAAADRLPLLL